MKRRILLRAAGWAAASGLCPPIALAAPRADTQALAGLLEQAQRRELPALLVERIRAGLQADELTAALAVAAARCVQPYPSVGFKYHAVMVLQAVAATAREAAPADRWLPLIWAADYFKRTQAQEQRAGGWRLPDRAARANLAEPAARAALTQALDRFDRDAADAAVTDYLQIAAPRQLFDVLFRYGTRDLRDIGHKAITVQNAHRLLGVLDDRAAQPLLRSTVAALANSGSDTDPASGDYPADRPWRELPGLLAEVPQGWREGRLDAGARGELLAGLRSASQLEAQREVADLLAAGIGPASIREALFAYAAELLLRQPSVVPVHAQTTANALHYASHHAIEADTPLRALLQCAAFMPMFRDLVGTAHADLHIDTMAALDGSGADLDEVFDELAQDRRRAAGKALGYLERGGSRAALIARARHMLARHATQPHEFKLAEAVFENDALLQAGPWRDRVLAASAVYFAAADRSNDAVTEAAALLAT